MKKHFFSEHDCINHCPCYFNLLAYAESLNTVDHIWLFKFIDWDGANTYHATFDTKDFIPKQILKISATFNPKSYDYTYQIVTQS